MSSIEKAISKARKGNESSGNYRDAVKKNQAGQHEVRRSKLKNAGFSSFLEQKKSLSLEQRQTQRDEFRQIKRPVLENIFGKTAHDISHANLVMITSATQNEGKSYNAVNLALSVAEELDCSVLLVDLDVRMRSISCVFDCDKEPGIMDVLSGDTLELPDVIIDTGVEGLKFIPAGHEVDNIHELLTSKKMSSLLDEISSRYKDRVVIIDTPPLLATTEALSLANAMGQIVVVVEADRTNRALVEKSIQMLDKTKPISLILNKVTWLQKSNSQYGYLYGAI